MEETGMEGGSVGHCEVLGEMGEMVGVERVGCVQLSLLEFHIFHTDGVNCAPYFVQPVVELLVVATSQTTHHRLLIARLQL